MSHFLVGIIIPKNIKSEVKINQYIDSSMEPFSEEKHVEPYIDEDKEEIKQKYDETMKEAKKASKKYLKEHDYLKKYKDNPKMSIKEFWKNYARKELDKDGNSLTTYNPDSKWDWYRVGGRWDGEITNNKCKIPRSEDGFNFDSQHESIKNNSIKIKDYLKLLKKNFEEYSCFALLTPEGRWYERGNMGWWGMVSNEKNEKEYKKEYINILKEYEDNILVGLDCHI